MIKKKLLCFSLILTLASCLVACGDNEEKKSAETTTESTQESTTPEVETTTEEETTTEKTSSAVEETTTEAPTTEAPTTEAPTTEAPTQKPTEAPTTEAPTQKPTEAPTTEAPTQKPTEAPTTEAPTQKPTEPPTQKPTEAPTQKPTEAPTTVPALTERQQECASALKLFYYDEHMINRGSAYRSLTTGAYEGGTAFTKEELDYVSNYLGLDWVEKGYDIYCLFAGIEEWLGRDEEIKALQNDYTSYTYEEAAYIIDKYIANYMN